MVFAISIICIIVVVSVCLISCKILHTTAANLSQLLVCCRIYCQSFKVSGGGGGGGGGRWFLQFL